MVDLSHVLTHLIVLNDLSTVQVVAGRSVVLSSLDARLEKVPYFSPSPEILILPGFQTDENFIFGHVIPRHGVLLKTVKVV